ncbi:PepSY-associated TM helix domain-containing protein [Aquabacter sp. P-9]|uniref:PepSY-associated TM helix domain-containing protein n=1 Tax=Aquabacter sediminis TaxID=3029197 RepID=UPI00237D7D45|nr:PepSY-associated TM helix domain-containing protein [Aquabacter sp. P-9]MDE1570025.1 PepSY-associated TM helix domain-containing protein [Aquabacter sp. P-9]
MPGSRRAPAKKGAASSPAGRTFKVRPILVLMHRCIGLTTAVFLTLAGLTGSVIAFNRELDGLLNPAFYAATAKGPTLSPEALAAKVEARDPLLSVWSVSLEPMAGGAVEVRAMAREGEPSADWFSLDPVSGEILGARVWGACCLSRAHLIPFLYNFHHSLSLPGALGVLVMGIVALFWLLDSFIGAALTLPLGRPFFRKWRTAFTIKGGSAFRLNLDWHRAAGLWLFAVLMVLAVSSIAMNLRTQVFEPVVQLFSPLTPTPFAGPLLPEPLPRRLSYDAVIARAQAEARTRGWDLPPTYVFYSPAFGLFGVRFGSGEEMMTSPWLYLDGRTAAPVGQVVPGAGTAGDTFLQLQFPLHSGRIAGLPGRILIAVMGVVVAGLSITGVAIWWIKRAARRQRRGGPLRMPSGGASR